MTTLNQIADRRLLELTDEVRSLARARLTPPAGLQLGPQLSLSRALQSFQGGQLRHGEDREALEEYARQVGASFDPQRPLIPFSACRDLNKATGGAGGFLVGTDTADAVDILRPWSVTARAGIVVETGLIGDQAVPKVSAKSTPAWLTNETTQMTPSQPTLVSIAMTPKNVGAVVNFSRHLAKQTNAESFVRRELMRTVGTAVDQAVLNGSGASGQPTGLLGTTGVQTQSGTTLQQAGVTAMKQKVATANVNDENIVFLSTPAIRESLENRLRTGNSSFYVWHGDKVADRPAYVSTDVPAATMVAGDFANIYLGIWGSAFVLEVNPYDPTHFRSGVIQARIIVSCDVAVLHPAAFCKSESIT